MAGPGVLVAPAAASGPARSDPPSAALEPAFVDHMTADDVARGIYGLAGTAGPEALTPAQRAALAPEIAAGAALRARLGELRMARREVREAGLANGAAIAGIVGRDRLDRAVGR